MSSPTLDGRKCEINLKSNTPLGSIALPKLDEVNWDKKAEFRITWRESFKIQLKGTITSITLVPEPSALLILASTVFGLLVLRRKRHRVFTTHQGR